jgi:glycosyltransferase involved in cell wall biosynthesis
MRVWIENPFDNLPVEGFRPQRYWLMAEAFVKAGNDVTLWTSDFSHARKTARTITQSSAPFRLKFVKTPPYKSNVCVARIRSHRAYAANWLADALADAKVNGIPDILIASLPPLSTGDAALSLKRELGARLVLDVMDSWPETFYRLIPKPFRFLGPVALSGMHATARRAYTGADIVTGVCDAYEKIAHKYGAHSYTRFYHGVSIPREHANKPKASQSLSLVYAGNFGRGYDLATAINAVKKMDGASLDIAGAGEREAEWRKCAADSPQIRFHGYLDAAELGKLLDSATIGVIPLSNDTFVGLPYKLGDYAVHGLKMVTSLSGECAAILERHGAGAVYKPGDTTSFIDAVTKVSSMKWNGAGLLKELDAERIYSQYVDFVTQQA